MAGGDVEVPGCVEPDLAALATLAARGTLVVVAAPAAVVAAPAAIVAAARVAHLDIAGSDVGEACKNTEDGCLACAGRAVEGEDAALFQLESDVEQLMA